MAPVFLGFGKMSDAKRRQKIRQDLDQIGKILPDALGLEKEFGILTEAVRRAEGAVSERTGRTVIFVLTSCEKRVKYSQDQLSGA